MKAVLLIATSFHRSSTIIEAENHQCAAEDLSPANHLRFLSTENLHLASNVSNGTNIPLRSIDIPNQRLYRGPIHCIGSILQTEGLQGLYRGAGAMVLRDVPGYVLYFIPYTIFCDMLTPDASSSPHPGSIWLAGGLA
ncbi:solute carrier family 25 member 48-like, partial [Plectropomus leopardus]|uniref:solute carrier family 25 member 48-like n=1 Tax=Plectropomus leopardus TaxID=160734 RepID=UPI001C4ADE4D